MPRPNIAFPLDLAFAEADRLMIASGITTAFHGLTISWEPGLRSLETARDFVAAWRAARGRLSSDTRLHLRWETFALDAVPEVREWLAEEPRPILAFNDHTTAAVDDDHLEAKSEKLVSRTGLSVADYKSLLRRVWARAAEVPSAVAGLAGQARDLGVVMLAHDENSPEARAYYRSLGAGASEFPLTRQTAEAARAAGEHIILGAPNVVRGGSHIGAMGAARAAGEGLCSVLASDYYYPAPLQAAFLLAADHGMDLARAWDLVSRNPAEVAGLDDRGRIAEGLRGDLVLVDAENPRLPRVVAAFVAGRPVYLSESARLR